MNRFSILLIFLSALFVTSNPPALADQLKSIQDDGSLELISGNRVCLAGLHLSSESMRMLPALLAKHEIEWKEAEAELKMNNVTPAYIFVAAQVLTLPFDSTADPIEEKIMLNEFLISLGAAKVEQNKSFSYKEKFLALEEEARQKGAGIWSYDPSFSQHKKKSA